ncbi:Carboxylesterase [Aspergillus carlsbadensis]|nr:Carboxylesterase [Aspergillus carlsbadensis]
MKLLSSTTLSALAGAATSTALASSSPSVTLDAGRLMGGRCSSAQDAVYYKGIPFAEPPVGSLRFEPPQPYTGTYPKGGVLNATSSAPACIQFGSSTVPPGEKSEDCLYLDIWAPASATQDSNLPVKVWVFGGSDTEGGTGYSLYDGCNLAETGAVVVALNYRLGPLGFLALDGAGIQGNQGIQDLILGFEWVQQSIAAFGGDPEKVLAFGQSAGATDLFALASLPQAPSLFKSVIIESIALPQLTATSAAQKLGASFANTLGCSPDDKSCLQSASASDIQKAFSSDPYTGSGAYSLRVANSQTPKYWPIVDGTVIKENPLDRGSQVPVVLGYNQQEGTLDAISAYNSPSTIASLTAANYTAFLESSFGHAEAEIIAKYYPLSAYEAAVADLGLTAGSGVFKAIAHVLTDAHFKCPTYQSALASAQNSQGVNPGVWVYEFTHNNTCAWLDTLVPIADDLSFLGAAHTAEIPFVLGNLDFDYTGEGVNYTCRSSDDERALSREMISLWTAMAEGGDPSTDAIQWPGFSIASSSGNAPGMVFGNESTPGTIDFSVCKLWAQVFAVLDADQNSTATGVSSPSGSVLLPSATASPTSSVPFEGGAVSASVGGSIAVSAFLMVVAALA